MKFPKIWRERKDAKSEVVDWRSQITRPASVLEVGGFRPTNAPNTSCFGEVRVAKVPNDWPHRRGKPLWPVCQLNLLEAPFVPSGLEDLAMVQFFIADDYMSSDNVVADTDDEKSVSSFYVRAFPRLDHLVPVTAPSHGSVFLPFEARWLEKPKTDYPTHDTMPIDFDSLRIGSYYEQHEIDGVHKTKLGGWPSCIQSEPWWDYRDEGNGFEYVLQINSEEKSKCWWGHGGSVFVARHKTKRNFWAFDLQCF